MKLYNLAMSDTGKKCATLNFIVDYSLMAIIITLCICCYDAIETLADMVFLILS